METSIIPWSYFWGIEQFLPKNNVLFFGVINLLVKNQYVLVVNITGGGCVFSGSIRLSRVWPNATRPQEYRTSARD